MHTIVETPEYLRAAGSAGMTDEERFTAVTQIAADPLAGDLIQGGGGIRKVRVRGKGRGKSGGYRVVTYYLDQDTPVFLLTVISKGSQANLTDRQKAEVRTVAKTEKANRR